MAPVVVTAMIGAAVLAAAVAAVVVDVMALAAVPTTATARAALLRTATTAAKTPMALAGTARVAIVTNLTGEVVAMGSLRAASGEADGVGGKRSPDPRDNQGRARLEALRARIRAKEMAAAAAARLAAQPIDD